MTALSLCPFWVEPPAIEPGSLDPLGDQARAEALAERLLPGVTVQTKRMRYLSFLCWARARGLEDSATDRWEVALSLGEYARDQEDDDHRLRCAYLGRRLLGERKLAHRDRVPRRLHQQTARVLYRALLRTSGLLDENEDLTDLGKDLACKFGKKIPKTLPAQVFRCRTMPCLSWEGEEVGALERRRLAEALFEASSEAEVRARTRRAVGASLWRRARHDAAEVLRAFLDVRYAKAGEPARTLHEAAVFELEAYARKRLFLHVYSKEGRIHASLPTKRRFDNRHPPYRIRSEPEALLDDVVRHLQAAERLGGSRAPRKLSALLDDLLQRHHEAKADAPWVSDSWRVLRPGLSPAQIPQPHSYRFSAFASLLADVEASWR